MKLQEQINRIQSMMGLNESKLPPYLLRRLKLNPDEILKELKRSLINRKSGSIKTKEDLIKTVFSNASYDLIIETGILDDASIEFQKEYYRSFTDYLKDSYGKELEDYYDLLYEGTDDTETYCFIKHSDKAMDPLVNRGFGDCIKGWHNFLSAFGWWFPDLNWREVKEKATSNPNKIILIKKPKENHNFEYYFSIKKTTE